MGVSFCQYVIFSEYFGAQVTWEDQTKTVTVKQGSKTISLQIGNAIAQIDGKDVFLRTYVPLRFIGEALGRYVDWDQTERAVYIDTDAVSSTMQMSFGRKKRSNVKVVKVFLNNPHVDLKIAYGQNQIGLTESLLSMAQRSNAICCHKWNVLQSL